MESEQRLFLIGGYSSEIVVAALQGEQLKQIGRCAASSKNPSFLALHPTKPVVYACHELEDGSLGAYRYNTSSGELHPLGSPIPSGGSCPAAASVHPSGSWLLFANYFGSSFGIAAIDPHTGELQQHRGELKQVQASTLGPVADRQEAPHPHQLLTDATGKFAFVCDLGMDVVHQLQLDPLTGKLSPNLLASQVPLAPGSGPRHLTFAANARFAYGVNELTNTVQQYAYDSTTGTLRVLNSWSTLEGLASPNPPYYAAEVAVSPDGEFLYASNREVARANEDTIAVFKVEQGSGELHFQGLDAAGGIGPRHFTFDPSGRMLLVALQVSNAVALLRREPLTGRLSFVSRLDGVQEPSFVQFI